MYQIFSDPLLIEEIEKYARKKTIKKEEVLISSGSSIVFVPLVIKGSLRILRQDAEGREVFLYHLFPGQTCAMSLNCCQAQKESQVKAIAEEDTEILQIPVEFIEGWFKYSQWKEYINQTYHQRFTELLGVIDLIAFSNMDKQLLHYLQKRSAALQTKQLNITHQEIADELHTHREAISRLLRTMEQKDMVRLGRNTIEIL